jgi:hypothetical protein
MDIAVHDAFWAARLAIRHHPAANTGWLTELFSASLGA